MRTFRSLAPRALVTSLLLSALAPAASARTIAQTVRSGSVDVKDGKICYEATGGGPALILISGGSGMDLGEWEEQFLPLQSLYDVVRYDPRGFGKSTAASGPFAPHEDLLALLDYLHIERAHIVGASSGGKIAIDFALAHPERVRSLVLVAPSVGGYEFPEEFRKREAAFVAVLRKDGPAAFAKAVLDDEYLIQVRGSTLHHKAKKMLEDNAHRLLETDPSWILGLDPPAIGRLEEIKARTLVIVGDEDHPEVLKLAEIVLSRIPGAKKAVVEKAGHTPYMERRKVFNRALLDFLAGVHE